ncbi:MAG: NAD(P)/FAD-dependent oxidoreductase [Ruminococcaceae bacterium]|nr:NAD(P)/FAD-dependent oxidoreductase [Oscillospiraceae bacterium]
MNKVAVVGGGAAGLFCAGTLKSLGADVTLFEKNRVWGKKLLITGKGRCNVTNDCTPDEVIKNVPRNGKFLFSAVNSFTPRDVMDFFESRNVPLKTERGRRVFPVSDSARDIRDALWNYCKGVKTVNEAVTDIIAENGSVCGVKTQNASYDFDKVVVCTGGLSYPLTGSTGDGYTFAERLGHTVIEPMPSLVPMLCKEECCCDMMGLTLKNVVLTLWDIEKKKRLFEEMGEMLFTHFGVSGPLVLSASAHIGRSEKEKAGLESGRYKLKIDLKPALDSETLNNRILSDFEKYKNKNFVNSLGDLLPSGMVSPVIEQTGIPPVKKVNEITRAERMRLIEVLKSFELTVCGFRPIDEAIITSGGVKTSEIDPGTMQSKLVEGLYFAGEVIDTDAYTGGFNLQIAFSTAYLAAKAIHL